MKLLIITQVVDTNDPILGFFHNWINELSKKFESIIVICLKKGEINLPSNVKVLSLGKEDGESRLKYVIRFFKYIIKYRKEYDSVFVHMNQIYVILGGLVWKMMGKKIYLWYAHGSVSASLKLAERFVENIITSSKKGMRLETFKKKVVGQGIDVNYFIKGDSHKNTILSLGRLSETKNIHLFIEAIMIVKEKDQSIRAVIVGEALTKLDKEYVRGLHVLVEEYSLKENVEFVGAVPPRKILPYYQGAKVFVNLSQTGSMDKTVLEAMSVNVPVVTSNEAYLNEGFDLIETTSHPKEVADNILKAYGRDTSKAREQVEEHSLESLVNKIVKIIEEND
jgi:glycosyltransferase involved in cell wall biosynthesis